MSQILTVKERQPHLNRAFISLLLATYIADSRFLFQKVEKRGSPPKGDSDMTADEYTSREFGDSSRVEVSLDGIASGRELPPSRIIDAGSTLPVQTTRQVISRQINNQTGLLNELEVKVTSSGVYIAAKPSARKESILLYYVPFTYDGFTAVNGIFRNVYAHSLNPKNFEIFRSRLLEALGTAGYTFKPGEFRTITFPSDRSDYEFTVKHNVRDELDLKFEIKWDERRRMISNPQQYDIGTYTMEAGFTFIRGGKVLGSIDQSNIYDMLGRKQFCNEVTRYTGTETNDDFASQLIAFTERFIQVLENGGSNYFVPMRQTLTNKK